MDVGPSQLWYITDKFWGSHSSRQWALQTSLSPLVSFHPHCEHSSCNPKWSRPSAMLNINLKGDRWASNNRKSVGHWQILLWKEHSFIVVTVYMWRNGTSYGCVSRKGCCVTSKVTLWSERLLYNHQRYYIFCDQHWHCNVWLLSLFWGPRLTC